MRNKIIARMLAAVVTALLMAVPLWGYVLKTDNSGLYVVKWHRTPVVMHIKLSSTANLLDGHSRRSSVAAAMQIWNAQLGTVQFSPQLSTPGAYSNANGVNEIVIDSRVDGEAFPAGALAITIGYRRGDEKTETDIVFNSAYTWNSYRGGLRNGLEDIQRVAIHELGHALGLDHPDEHGQSVNAIMNSRMSHIDTLQNDDIAGGQKLYGPPGFIPANDHFANASVITLLEGTSSFNASNIASTREAGEPGHADSTGEHSVWWKWTAPGNGSIVATTLGSDFDTVLAIYTGSSVAALTMVVANDDEEPYTENSPPQRKRTSKVSFDVVGGTTYYFAVDGWGDMDGLPSGYTGSIKLNLNFISPPIFTLQPIDQNVKAGETARFSAAATGASYRWQRMPAGGSSWLDLSDEGAYSFTQTDKLWVRTTLGMDGDRFRCVATGVGGTTFSNAAVLRVEPIPLPLITSQLLNSTAFVGHGTGLAVQASGATSYQWFRNGVLLPGRTDGSFFVADAQPADAGTYHVVVSNAGGSVTSTPATLTVRPVFGVVSVQATETYAMFLRGDGSRWFMGYALWSGGENVRSPRPLMVMAGDPSVLASAAGRFHNLFIKPDGTLWAHGDNSHGQLGDGTTTSRYVPIKVANDVVAVAAGRFVSYFIKSDGSLWGMGENGSGQLGDGTTTDRSTPVLIAQSVSAIAANYHRLLVTIESGHAFFIKADGTLWAMGANHGGQLGDGTTTNRSVPVQMATDVATAIPGSLCSFFIKRDGTLWGMGDNFFGTLGDGTNTSRSTPVLLMSNVAAAAAGYAHTLILKTDRSLWLTGDVSVQFGNEPNTIRSTPFQVASDVVTMAAGVNNSYYVKTDGSLWSTGNNQNGKLGLPNTAGDYELTPGRVTVGPLSAPASPANLKGPIARSDDPVVLRWAASLGATYYEIWRNTSNDSPGTVLLAANVANPLYYDSSARPDTVYYYWVRAVNPAGLSNFGPTVRAPPVSGIRIPASSAAVAPGQGVNFAVGTHNAATVQWQRNGSDIAGATSTTFTISSVQPADAGIYTAVVTSEGSVSSSPAVLGVATSVKVTGAATEVGSDIQHPNGNTFDQIQLGGSAAAFTAEFNRNHITRLSYVDLNNDIVQVEFAGPGTVSILLDGSSGPAAPVNYNQPGVVYMKGHAGIVVSGATENTHLSVFSVGRANAVNQALFRDDVTYDGVADIAFIAILSSDGKFGGLRTANASYWATRGFTGIHAPDVEFTGPVYIGDINAQETATPVLVIGAAAGDTLVTGGNLAQDNQRAVQVSGLSQLRFTAGTTSHDRSLPAQANQGRLEENGIDVTAQVVVNPGQ